MESQYLEILTNDLNNLSCDAFDERYVEKLHTFLGSFGHFLENYSCTHDNIQKLSICVVKYLEYIQRFVESSNCSFYIYTHSIQRCLVVVSSILLVNDNIGDAYFDNIARHIFEKLTDPCIKLWLAKDILKELNKCLQNTKIEKRMEIAINCKLYLYKLVDLISVCGDYEFQTYLLEAIFRICSYEQLKQYGKEFFPEANDLAEGLSKICVDNFEQDVRIFLNCLNSKFHNVYSIKCIGAYLGKVCLSGPKKTLDDSQNSELWIDFNFKAETISILCDRNSLRSSPPASNDSDETKHIDVVTIFVNNVTSVNIVKYRSADSTHPKGLAFQLKLSSPCHVLYSSSRETAVQDKLKLVFYDSVHLDYLMDNVMPRLFKDKYKVLDSRQPATKTNTKVSKALYRPLGVKFSRGKAKPTSTTESSISDPATSLRKTLLTHSDTRTQQGKISYRVSAPSKFSDIEEVTEITSSIVSHKIDDNTSDSDVQLTHKNDNLNIEANTKVTSTKTHGLFSPPTFPDSTVPDEISAVLQVEKNPPVLDQAMFSTVVPTNDNKVIDLTDDIYETQPVPNKIIQYKKSTNSKVKRSSKKISHSKTLLFERTENSNSEYFNNNEIINIVDDRETEVMNNMLEQNGKIQIQNRPKIKRSYANVKLCVLASPNLNVSSISSESSLINNKRILKNVSNYGEQLCEISDKDSQNQRTFEVKNESTKTNLFKPKQKLDSEHVPKSPKMTNRYVNCRIRSKYSRSELSEHNQPKIASSEQSPIYSSEYFTANEMNLENIDFDSSGKENIKTSNLRKRKRVSIDDKPKKRLDVSSIGSTSFSYDNFFNSDSFDNLDSKYLKSVGSPEMEVPNTNLLNNYSEVNNKQLDTEMEQAAVSFSDCNLKIDTLKSDESTLIIKSDVKEYENKLSKISSINDDLPLSGSTNILKKFNIKNNKKKTLPEKQTVIEEKLLIPVDNDTPQKYKESHSSVTNVCDFVTTLPLVDVLSEDLGADCNTEKIHFHATIKSMCLEDHDLDKQKNVSNKQESAEFHNLQNASISTKNVDHSPVNVKKRSDLVSVVTKKHDSEELVEINDKQEEDEFCSPIIKLSRFESAVMKQTKLSSTKELTDVQIPEKLNDFEKKQKNVEIKEFVSAAQEIPVDHHIDGIGDNLETKTQKCNLSVVSNDKYLEDINENSKTKLCSELNNETNKDNSHFESNLMCDSKIDQSKNASIKPTDFDPEVPQKSPKSLEECVTNKQSKPDCIDKKQLKKGSVKKLKVDNVEHKKLKVCDTKPNKSNRKENNTYKDKYVKGKSMNRKLFDLSDASNLDNYSEEEFDKSIIISQIKRSSDNKRQSDSKKKNMSDTSIEMEQANVIIEALIHTTEDPKRSEKNTDKRAPTKFKTLQKLPDIKLQDVIEICNPKNDEAQIVETNENSNKSTKTTSKREVNDVSKLNMDICLTADSDRIINNNINRRGSIKSKKIQKSPNTNLQDIIEICNPNEDQHQTSATTTRETKKKNVTLNKKPKKNKSRNVRKDYEIVKTYIKEETKRRSNDLRQQRPSYRFNTSIVQESHRTSNNASFDRLFGPFDHEYVPPGDDELLKIWRQTSHKKHNYKSNSVLRGNRTSKDEFDKLFELHFTTSGRNECLNSESDIRMSNLKNKSVKKSNNSNSRKRKHLNSKTQNSLNSKKKQVSKKMKKDSSSEDTPLSILQKQLKFNNSKKSVMSKSTAMENKAKHNINILETNFEVHVPVEQDSYKVNQTADEIIAIDAKNRSPVIEKNNLQKKTVLKDSEGIQQQNTVHSPKVFSNVADVDNKVDGQSVKKKPKVVILQDVTLKLGNVWQRSLRQTHKETISLQPDMMSWIATGTQDISAFEDEMKAALQAFRKYNALCLNVLKGPVSATNIRLYNTIYDINNVFLKNYKHLE